MEINNVTIEWELFGKPYYGTPPVKEGAGPPNRKTEDGVGQSGIARSTTDDNKVVLPRDQTTTSDTRSLVPVKQYIAKDNTENSFPDKGLDPKKTFSVAKSIYSLNIDTHFVKNQYAIDKVVMDITERAVNKYREAQAYGYRLISTLEVYA
jgi:hypothetical protein